MNTESDKNTIQERVLEAIKTGEVAMRPRWHFVLKTLLMTFGVIIVLLALLYFASLIIFGLRETGIILTPSFGFRGIFIFLKSLPWLLVILLLVFIIILEILVRHYSFAYRRPLLYSALAIVLLVCVGGWVITRTPFHGVIMKYTEQKKIPVVSPFYEKVRRPVFKDVHTGQIIFITPIGFDMRNPSETILMIHVTSRTKLQKHIEFTVGDRVMVIGPRVGDRVEAFGVRPLSGEMK